ncbi:ATP-binding protein [Paraburkholderia sp. CI3]|uniref:ATP-binding protein n=1 Tax=Paraburkholderia sp. CI3 TaxID=2991060 RepID=UPI003D1D4FD4
MRYGARPCVTARRSDGSVKRHAKASRVRIDMTCAGPIVSLDIEDDGVGVALDRSQGTDSFGLLGIRERVRQLRGNVSFTSSPGHGFRISIQTPADALA